MTARVCDLCPAPAVAVSPGAEPVRELFVLARGEPVRCWCLACWTQRFGQEAAAA